MSFSNTIWQEFTKRNDVMYIERLMMFTLGQSTTLTSVIVALSGLLTDDRPLRTIVLSINLAALPVTVILAHHAGALPCIMASVGAKARAKPLYILLFARVSIAALLTGQDCRPSVPSWGRFADKRLAPSSIAGLIAKSMGVLGELTAGSFNGLAAMSAWFNYAPLSAISRAKTGAILAVWGNLERLAAAFANLCNEGAHGINSNEKTLVGHTSDWCRSNQDDRQGFKHNDTCTRQGAQSGCYLIASTGVV